MNCPFLLGFQQSDADLHHMRICSVVSWLCTAKLFSHLINIPLIKIPLLLLIKALAFAQAQIYLGKHFQQPPWSAGWSSIPQPPDYLHGPQLYCCLSHQPCLEHLCGSSFIPCQSNCIFLPLPSSLRPALLLPRVGTHGGSCHTGCGCDVKWMWM